MNSPALWFPKRRFTGSRSARNTSKPLRGTGPSRLRQVPSLGWRAVAVPELEPCAIGGAAARYIETAAGSRVHEPALISPAPLLGAGAVAIPELDFRAICGPSTSGVHAFSEDTKRPVAAVPRPALCVRTITRPDLDRGSVARARTRIVNALAAVVADRPGTSVLRLDHRRRVDVVAGVDRLGEP